MNTEDEIFFPTMSVGATLDFATRMKVPYRLPPGITSPEQYAKVYKEFLLKSLGIEHTHDTKVGDEYIRGVSGGERKRVSILECLATRGSVFCWDNSTRGLDAGTALDWTKAMRAMTDILGLTTIATLYQAGNGIYEQFDKVLILDEGKQIYYGPTKDAVPFMQDLGFLCDPAANQADFLTSVTTPGVRAVAEGYEQKFPRNGEAVRAAYERSSIKEAMIAELDYPGSEEAKQNTTDFKEMIARDRHKSLPENASVTTSFYSQVKTAVTRQYQILWGDKPVLIVKQVSALIQALVAGSLFYAAPDHSGGLFLKGGALFFCLLYPAYVGLSEVTDSFSGRPVLAKHRSFALHYPAAFVIAQVATDIPLMLFQMSHFGIVIYFMVGLQTTAEAFFTFWIVIFASAMAMTACFRMIGAAFPTFDAATKASGLLVSALFMYMGYMIIKPEMKPWFVWIFWINPMAYAFEALLGNEFHDQRVPCVGPNLAPNGPGYAPDQGGQSCIGVNGAQPGAMSVMGDDYLASMSFSHSHLWRNLGIIFAWWVFFVAVTVLFTSRWKEMGEGGRGLLIPREKEHKTKHIHVDDEESQTLEKPHASSESSTSDDTLTNQLIRNTSVFTWKNLTYTVKTPSGDRVLLDNVQGFVKPGTLGALMGSSGVSNILIFTMSASKSDTVYRLARRHFSTFSPSGRPMARSMVPSWLMDETFRYRSSVRPAM
jgi:ATP-binding cassette subfamily G (WHITE) protein 2 (SNQ2)